jgi:hypothetical protein
MRDKYRNSSVSYCFPDLASFDRLLFAFFRFWYTKFVSYQIVIRGTMVSLDISHTTTRWSWLLLISQSGSHRDHTIRKKTLRAPIAIVLPIPTKQTVMGGIGGPWGCSSVEVGHTLPQPRSGRKTNPLLPTLRGQTAHGLVRR